MTRYFLKFRLFFVLLALGFFSSQALAQASAESVELNGDTVEYAVEGNRVIAEGDVSVIYGESELYCDKLEFERDTMVGHADGNVRLITGQGTIRGDHLTYNFKTMKGDFKEAQVEAPPFYGTGETVRKVDENLILIENGYITTSDFDKPEYRLTSKKIEVYPGEKMVARGVKLMLGKVPSLYLPRYTQRLDNKKPRFTITPGYDKDWGVFVLTQWRYNFQDYLDGAFLLDARERKDLALGTNLEYNTKKYGTGSLKLYYMNERSITSKRFYQERPSPTIERERYRAQWRHKWDVDDKTKAVMQYYRLSDATFLKDYFENENKDDSSPNSYFLMTRRLPKGILSFRTDFRVNRFNTEVERLPELRYDLSSQEIFDTGLYYKNTSTYSNLTKKYPSPTEVRQNTARVDVDQTLNYPMKIGFVEMKPYVGTQHTYYSKTKDPNKYGAIRGIFRTGASLSTKFYRIFDMETDKFGLDINRLRHIITPSVAYSYASKPTVDNSDLDSYDTIDTLTNDHKIVFSLENKLQTKRDDKSVDLARAAISSTFNLKEDPSKGGFNDVTVDIDFKPADWLTFYFDSKYDVVHERLSTANFDMYINGGKNWALDIGKRWNRNVDDQITAELEYTINPKWSLKLYERYDLRNGLQKEQQFKITRDLHSWDLDMIFGEKRGEGNEILFVFTLKAFPDLSIDAGTSFNKRKAGSQSGGGS